MWSSAIYLFSMLLRCLVERAHSVSALYIFFLPIVIFWVFQLLLINTKLFSLMNCDAMLNWMNDYLKSTAIRRASIMNIILTFHQVCCEFLYDFYTSHKPVDKSHPLFYRLCRTNWVFSGKKVNTATFWNGVTMTHHLMLPGSDNLCHLARHVR